MDIHSQSFVELAKVFQNNGFHLYLVGGTVRDLLLNIDLTDMDAVTDATPEEMKTFLKADYTFAKVGSVKYKINGVKFDITTLRKEKGYQDHRHPSEVIFIKDLKGDHVRRDFTINAMYMDDHFRLYDFENGLEDLNNRLLRMVGNPYKRLKEDPLRIIRCIRFSLVYDLSIEKTLENALVKSAKYLKYVSKDKVQMELNKTKNELKDKQNELLKNYSINTFIDVVE